MTSPAYDADFIVVGSGPAGVSVARPLIEAGNHVLMIDGARRADTPTKIAEPWKRILGADLEALLPEDGLSPKLRTPVARRLIDGFQKASNVHGEDFVAVGAKARGGLSTIWGAFVCEFDQEDVEDWPFPIEDLRPSYKSITERMGVSGSTTDELAGFFGRSGEILPHLPIGPTAGQLLQRYAPGSQGPDFGLGIARNAILTIDREDRKACNLQNDCLWGCDRRAIYDARFDLAWLEKQGQFQLVEGAFATGIAPDKGAWRIKIEDGRSFRAKRIILSAGVLGTAALVMPLLPSCPSELQLLSSPVLAMPMLVPGMLGRAAPEKAYSLAQLGYRLRYGDAASDYVTGAFYEVHGLPASSFVARLPFSRPAGTDFFAMISTALLVATGYFPGTYSKNVLRATRQDGHTAIIVKGGHQDELAAKVKIVTRRLRSVWQKLGAWTLPAVSLATPGTDVHYGGVFPMGSNAPYGSSAFGELNGAPGLFVADGSSFPSIPSKHITLTIMANADRIGRHLSKQASN